MKLKLQETLDAFTAELIDSGKIPNDIVKGLKEGIAEQVASGRADLALKAGKPAPTFTLSDAEGNRVSSVELLSRGPLIVSFYRGVWCPYCNIELKALEAVREDIEARGASIVAVSMQTAANSRKSSRENEVRFPILVDAGGFVAAQFGLRYSLSPETIQLYKTLGNDLQVINGEDSWTLPMPGRYVIGRDGIVAHAEINPDYTQRPEPSDLLPILDHLRHRDAA
ncbi:peroxiredoxin-like family protein [Pinirhizobacter soli]|uniref:peroxiredoxin-like family protein n=1 Tax=Pinirhizobacter soli TaxID=2786953 RepID=UPI00202A3727|nr:peroxiredoxin-like family protein [Pinirhizobacter soli]